VALAGWGTSAAHAAFITFHFSGQVNSVDPALSPTFSVGQTLAVSYTFDPTTPPRAGSDHTFAVFDALKSLNFTAGSYSAASLAAQEIQVDANPPSPNDDRYAVVSRASDGLTGPPVNGLPLDFFAFRLDAPSGSVFTDAEVLPTSLNLSDFTNQKTFFIFFGPPTSPSVVSGTITSFQVTGVPEPSGLALLGIGGLTLAGWRRWKGRRNTHI
jgi:hypothetical protein